MRNPSTTGNKITPCCSKVGLKRGPWTPEEDELLASYIKKEGEGRWRTLPKLAGLLRCGKSCRLRWMNYLRPSVKRGQIDADEEDLILRLHRLLGNRWSLIAGRIPGRTDNEIKNYWNTHLSKKLISQGIDPRTHKPLLNVNQGDDGINVNNQASKSDRKCLSSSAKESGSDDLQDYHLSGNSGGYTSFLMNNCEEGLGFGNIEGLTMKNEDDDVFTRINCCTDDDDVFSSFLNSLINEDDDDDDDASASLRHQQQLPNGSGGGTIESMPGSGSGSGSPSDQQLQVSSASCFNQKNERVVVDDEQ